MTFPDHGRVLFSATLVRGHIAKFHIPYLRWFKERGWETWVAAKNDYPDGICDIPYCDHFVDIGFARSPFSPQTLKAYRQMRELFSRERFDIVHTHTPVGSVLTRLAARDARRAGTKVIYTAHGFHFYDGAPFVNWMLWYPVERIMSRFTDVLVTINREDYGRAKRFTHCHVEYAPGVGVDLSRFGDSHDRDAIRASLALQPSDFAVLSVGDLNSNKNHGVLIGALAKLPGDVRLFVAGNGPLRDELDKAAKELGVADRVSLLGFRRDIAELLGACDLFCMPSLREGLPVSLMEAAAAGVPCLASKARGCADVLGDLAGDLTVSPNEPDSWADKIGKMRDQKLRSKTGLALRDRSRVFGLDKVVDVYAGIYERTLGGAIE